MRETVNGFIDKITTLFQIKSLLNLCFILL
jgi:hypothetical protein